MVSLRSSSRASTRNSEPPTSEFAADSDGEEEVELPTAKHKLKARSSVTSGNDAESDESDIELPRHRPVSSVCKELHVITICL